MSLTNTEAKYGSVSKFFHWTVALIVLTLLVVGFFMGDIADKALRAQVYMLHKSFGITVLSLMVLRILWTLSNVRPTYSPVMPNWQVKASHFTHFILYVLLLVMPLSGWIMSTAANRSPNFFGLVVMPFPGIGFDKPFAKLVSQVHTIAAWILVAMVTLHILAGLKHHFIDKDNIFRRMLPFSR